MSVADQRVLTTMGVNSVAPREWLTALSATLALILLMAIPYVLGYTLAGEDVVFTGIIMNAEDTQSYFAKMLQGYDGAWRYYIPFTPEAHEPVFLGGFYLALGHAARWLGLSLEAVWHGARVAADLLLGLSAYWFIAAFLRSVRRRVTAHLLALFGSGAGWVLLLLGQSNWLGHFPVDFHMPEAHLFFTAFTSPHVALGTALLLVGMRLLWQLLWGVGASDWGAALLLGLCLLLLVVVYPFLIYLATLSALLAGLLRVWQLWRAGRLASGPLLTLGSRVGVAFLMPAPLVIYYALVLRQNAVFRAWDMQAITPSPPWPHYVVAFGPLLFWAFLGLRDRERPASAGFLWVWLTAAALLVYAPLNPQRRFVQGAQAPLAILATVGFLGVAWPWLRGTRAVQALLRRPRYSAAGLRRFAIVLFLAGMSLSNLYVLASVSVTAAVEQPYPLFRAADEVQAAAWMRANGQREAVVLAAYQTGNYVAARAGNRVVLGHWAETVAFAEKTQAVQRFFRIDTSDEWRRALLQEYGVDYVWHGPPERWLGDFDPAAADYLRPVHRVGDVVVYRVD
ncbi:MAG TPA: hypothetical protein VK879_10700 [Candidatus Sulfomarinibacteraceae bacterium]|nr:hypothetical protein [Candidatus Sulfomarinibacteraceae bacterium]